MHTFYIKGRLFTKAIVCAIFLIAIMLVSKLIFVLSSEQNRNGYELGQSLKKDKTVMAGCKDFNYFARKEKKSTKEKISIKNKELSEEIALQPEQQKKKELKMSTQRKALILKKSEETAINKKTEIYTAPIASRGTTFGVCYEKNMVMEATAYTSRYEETGKHTWDPGYGITATGTKAKHGTVAVDPSIIPLGTKLYIRSTDGTSDYGYATAEDTGGAIKGMKIDLYYDNIEDAFKFGRRTVRVYIVLIAQSKSKGNDQ